MKDKRQVSDEATEERRGKAEHHTLRDNIYLSQFHNTDHRKCQSSLTAFTMD